MEKTIPFCIYIDSNSHLRGRKHFQLGFDYKFSLNFFLLISSLMDSFFCIYTCTRWIDEVQERE